MNNGAVVSNLRKTLEELKSFLPDYLVEKGIDTSRNFSCLSPQHSDNTPSCSMLPDRLAIFCHGCKGRWDLFDVMHFLDGKPISGPGFIHETVEPAAKKYGVSLERRPLTADEVYQLDTYRAYKACAEVLVTLSTWDDTGVQKYISEHGWAPDKLVELNIGSVSRDKVVDHLVACGYDYKFIKEVDLDREDIFSTKNIIFTTLDEHGQPVGFTARNTHFKNNGVAKYINQRTSGVKFDIFQKGKRLYGLFWALKNVNEDQPLYIFEGQPNVITAKLHGLHNSCAIGGTAFTSDHIILLKELGINNIILCLDGDKVGQETTVKLLDEKFALNKDIKVRIVSLPNETDPDEYIREAGINAFKDLAKWSAFEWRLQQCFGMEDMDPEIVTKNLVPHIATEPSYIAQEKMCTELSKWTGYSLKAIQLEVNRLQNLQDQRIHEERDIVVKRAFRDIQVNPEDISTILLQAHNQIIAIDTKYEEDKFSEGQCLRYLDIQKTTEEERDTKFAGFVLGPDLKELEDALSGDWSKDVFLTLGGKANAGKSSLMCKLAYEIASRTAENNATVIFHTIDDTTEQLLPKFICIADGSKTGLTINDIRQPGYWVAHGHKGIIERRNHAYGLIRNLHAEGRLILKDANEGNSISFAEALVSYYKEKYPGRRLVYFLDNLHKLPDFQKLDERVRFKTISSAMKSLATRHHIAVVSTVEYTKLAPGIKPSNYNVAETVALEYDTNLIAHIHNDLHDLGDNSDMFFFDSVHDKKIKMPILEFYIGKNKISDWKNKMFFYFYPASSDFAPAPPPDMKRTREEG